MTYCCNLCGFLFSRTGDVRECPSCEGTHFRPATLDEEVLLQELLSRKQHSPLTQKHTTA